MLFLDLFINAIGSGILIGGLYAALSIGMSISFGMLNVVNIAHPVFFVLGGYAAVLLNENFGIDPLLSGLIFTPLFFLIGIGIFQIYYSSFEKRGAESLRGLVFFFGVLFLLEVSLQQAFGVDFKSVKVSWLGKSFHLGMLDLPLRLLFPFLVSLLMTVCLHLFFSRTYMGITARGVSQDSFAVRLMGASSTRIKMVAFGLSIATTSIAGALLVIVMPIDPYMGGQFIGRVFAIAVMAGAGSVKGTLIAGIILGLAESITGSFGGPAWATAVSFGILLIFIVIRPSGLFRR